MLEVSDTNITIFCSNQTQTNKIRTFRAFLFIFIKQISIVLSTQLIESCSFKTKVLQIPVSVALFQTDYLEINMQSIYRTNQLIASVSCYYRVILSQYSNWKFTRDSNFVTGSCIKYIGLFPDSFRTNYVLHAMNT